MDGTHRRCVEWEQNTQEDASSADRSMTFGRTYTVYDSTTCNPHVSHFKFGVDANARIDE